MSIHHIKIRCGPQVVEGSVEGSPEGGSTARADLLGFLSDGASMLVRSTLLQVCHCRACFHLCECLVREYNQLWIRSAGGFFPMYSVSAMSAQSCFDV